MTPGEKSEPDLVAVARRQRELLWLILVGAVAYTLAMGLAAATSMSTAGVGAAVGAQLLFQIAWIVQTVRLFAAMRTAPVRRLVCIVLLLVPLVSLVIVALLSAQATSMLRAAGARIGLMGVPKEDFDRLRPGHCRGCGYNRQGLEPLQACPECNRCPG
jgi:hypothetical protein